MFLFNIFLACGEAEKVDKRFTEDTGADSESNTEAPTDTDTASNTDTNEDSEPDTNSSEPQEPEDPQWFEAGTYTGTYSCDTGFNPFIGTPTLEIGSTGDVSEVKFLETNVPLIWQCSITEPLNSTETEWAAHCTGNNSELFSSSKIYSEGFKIEMNLMFYINSYGTLRCEAIFE